MNKYTVTWKNEDGSTIGAEQVAYGVSPAHAAPEKSATAQYTYTFAGWNDGTTTYAPGAALPAVTKAVTYQATFSSTVNKYTVTWKNEDGSTIGTTLVAYGASPAHAEPEKAATAQYTYTFAGWNDGTTTCAPGAALPAVTKAVTYQATFSSTVNKYTVTWKNEDGSTIGTTLVAYGASPAHAEPEKAATAQYTYTFAGWNDGTETYAPGAALPAVTKAVTYRATFSSTVNKYIVTWKNEDGSTIDTTQVAYGTSPAHAPAEKASTPQCTYTFAGWTDGTTTYAPGETLPPVEGESVYAAVFDTLLTYTVSLAAPVAHCSVKITSRADYAQYKLPDDQCAFPEGQEFDVTFECDAGYGLSAFSMTCANGEPLDTDYPGVYKMPASDVTISVEVNEALPIAFNKAGLFGIPSVVSYLQPYYDVMQENTAKAAPGARVRLVVDEVWRIFDLDLDSVSVEASDGTAVAFTAECSGSSREWTVEFTMPDKPVTVTLPAVRVPHAELHLGENRIVEEESVLYFTPEADGVYHFVSAHFGELGWVIDDLGNEMHGLCLKAGQTYSVLLDMDVGDITVSKTDEEAAFYAVSIDPSITGGTLAVSMQTAPEGCKVGIAATPADGRLTGAIRACCTDGGGYEIPVWEEDDDCCYFYMPAGNVTVTATFAADAEPKAVTVTGSGEILLLSSNASFAVPGTQADIVFYSPLGREPIVTVETASGRRVEGMCFRYEVALWILRFTMPDEAVFANLTSVPGEYPALALGTTNAHAEYKLYTFTPEETGMYRFDAHRESYLYVCDLSGNVLGGNEQDFVVELQAGQTYYVAYVWLSGSRAFAVERVHPHAISVETDGMSEWSYGNSYVDNAEFGQPGSTACNGSAVGLRFFLRNHVAYGPDVSVTTASGKPVAFSVWSDEGQIVSFIMPDEDVTVSFRAVPLALPELALGTTPVTNDYQVFRFAADGAGAYRFASTGVSSVYVYDAEGVQVRDQDGGGLYALADGQEVYVEMRCHVDVGVDKAITVAKEGELESYAVTVSGNIAGGAVEASLALAPEGCLVSVAATPDPGMALASLTVTGAASGQTISVSQGDTYGGSVWHWYSMPGEPVVIDAEFEQRPYSVFVAQNIGHGQAWVYEIDERENREYYSGPVRAGTKICLVPLPEKGYGLVSWSVVDTTGAPVDVDEWGMFTMPASDVTVSAVFAEALPVVAESDAATSNKVGSLYLVANGYWMDNPGDFAVAPGATARLWITMDSFVLAPSATVATASGAAVASTIELNAADYEWIVRFTMPAEPVVVTLSYGQADYPALHEGTNDVDVTFACFTFTPTATGYYEFEMADGDSIYVDVYDAFGEEICDLPLIAGQRYYLDCYHDSYEAGHGVVVTRTDEAFTTYSVTVDPGMAGGTVTSSHFEAAEGYTVYLEAVPDDAEYAGVPRVTWVDGGEVTEIETWREEDLWCFVMPAGDVTVTATFARTRPIALVTTDERIDLYHLWSTVVSTFAPQGGRAIPGTEVGVYFYSAMGYDQRVVVETESGATVESHCSYSGNQSWTMTFTMPDEPVTVTFSLAPENYPKLVLGSNAVGPERELFSFTPSETGVYRFATSAGNLFIFVYDGHGQSVTGSYFAFTATLLAGQTYYVDASRFVAAASFTLEKTDDAVTTYSVSVDPDVQGGTVEVSTTSAPSGHRVYLTPVAAPGYAYVEDSLRVRYGVNAHAPDRIPDGSPFFFMPASDVTITAAFKPLPSEYPAYLAGADDLVKSNYKAWAAQYGADKESANEQAFLLGLDPATAIPAGAELLKVVQFAATETGCRIELASGIPGYSFFRPAGGDPSLLGNGIAAVEIGEAPGALSRRSGSGWKLSFPARASIDSGTGHAVVELDFLDYSTQGAMIMPQALFYRAVLTPVRPDLSGLFGE